MEKMVNLKRIAGPNLVASQYKGSVIKISLQVFVLLFVIFFPIVCLALVIQIWLLIVSFPVPLKIVSINQDYDHSLCILRSYLDRFRYACVCDGVLFARLGSESPGGPGKP